MQFLNFAENAAQTLCQLLARPVPIPKYKTPVTEFAKCEIPLLIMSLNPPFAHFPHKNVFAVLLQSSKLHPTLARNNSNYTNTTIVFTKPVYMSKLPINKYDSKHSLNLPVYMLKQLTVEAPDEKIRQTNLSCRTVTMRSRMRTETDCIRGFFVKKDFHAFPAYNPALSYNRIPVQIIQETLKKIFKVFREPYLSRSFQLNHL
jgi:hypothetical protein